MRLARVFPRVNRATPSDDMAFSGPPPGLFMEADEVHVSVTFTDDFVSAIKLYARGLMRR